MSDEKREESDEKREEKFVDSIAAEEGVTADQLDVDELQEEEVSLLKGERREGSALWRDWLLLPRVFPYLRPYRKLAGFSLVLTVAVTLVALAQPWPVAFVIDTVIGGEPAPGWVDSIFGSSTGSLIAVAVGVTLLLTALNGGFTIVNEYLTTKVTQHMGLDFRGELFQHLTRLSLAYHDNQRLGMIMYRLNTQASAIGSIVIGLPEIAESVLMIAGMAYITYLIDPLLALLAVAVMPFIAYSTTFYANRIEPELYRVRGLEGMNMAIAHEAMSMLRVILAFGRERQSYESWRSQGETALQARVKLTVKQTAFQLAVQLITAAGTAAVLGVGAYKALNGQISIGELTVVLSYIASIYQPLEQLTNTFTAYQQYFIGWRHALGLLEVDPDVTEKPDARKLEAVRGEIRLEGVSFSYETREHVLNDVSFEVSAGQSVAIVGPTGAGKSTLASLLPRFFDAHEGRVTIDGNDVRDLTLESLREQFSIVLQEPLLFRTSIAENIRYGKAGAKMKEVQAAAQAANIHDFITSLPQGYKTRLGERGAQISGGERQRIAVARAFLRDAPILILDEPTSSIDSKTESVILEALDRLMEGRTAILIAHRLSTLRSVDKIVVLNEGRLVEEGTHDELYANGALYRQLWEAQMRPDEEHEGVSFGAETAEPGGDRQVVLAGAKPKRARDRKMPAGTKESDDDGRLRRVLAQIRDAERRASEANERSWAALRRASEAPSEPAVKQPALGVPPKRPILRAIPGGKAAPAPASKPKVVLLGMLTRIPVGGVAWLVGQYATGFERLGYEVYYVEAHARTPSMFMSHEADDGAGKAAAYIESVAERFGLSSRWAFHALHENGHCYGMSPEQLDRLYRDAALIVNMHGGTLPLPEHAATDRLVFLGTDPVEVELEVHRGDERALEFLDQHVAYFTWGLNFGNPDCALPWARPYPFIPSPPPAVLDFWDNDVVPDGAPFTTIGNWRQPYRNVRHGGKVYRWSKHEQFLKILDLPLRSQAPIELALSSYEDEDHLLLAEHGWRVRPGLELSSTLDGYRDYIVGSAGELSVAKEQNVHFRSGWFSERSVTYLAAGRPVILQDTGFGAALPIGEGLFAFTDLDEAVEAIEAARSDPERHRRAAREIAREFLSHEVVLGHMLEHVGLRPSKRWRLPRNSPAAVQLPPRLSLEITSRRPLELDDETCESVLARPVPSVAAPPAAPVASVVVPVLDSLACTRLTLESVLANTEEPPYEVVAVDNGSGEETRTYLEVLAARNRHVRVIRNDDNRGFAAACNQGLAAAEGEILVLLNNDTLVPPGWLSGLVTHLGDATVGVVGPTTNRCGGGAQIPAGYTTYEEMLDFARIRRHEHAGGPPAEIDVVEMFCAAIRRAVFEEVGPLDERFEIGMFEDDDYMRRVRDAGYRIVCANDLFVHHFGEASLGALAADGRYGELFHANRRRFEEKWDVTWEPHARRNDPAYAALAGRVTDAVREHVPRGATVLVATRGDDTLVSLEGRRAWHFPQLDDGTYAGHHPADDEAVIAELEQMRERGAKYLVLPATSMWWLEHYAGFRRHLEDRYQCSSDDPETARIYRLEAGAERARKPRSST
jgi:ATP-binding cassette, subfamily B, bacterial